MPDHTKCDPSLLRKGVHRKRAVDIVDTFLYLNTLIGVLRQFFKHLTPVLYLPWILNHCSIS